MKRILNLIIIASFLLVGGCSQKSEYTYFSKTFTGSFDTITQYMTYAKTQEEFDKQCELIQKDLEYYDHLFDKYNDYTDIANIKTINNNAGVQAVKVEQPLIDLLELCIERNKTISNKVNIAFGNVINIWHDYREAAEANNGVGTVPTQKELEKANQHTSIDSIQIDKENMTVYIDDKNVNIDVGATAKGYAVELIKQDLIEMGVDNFLLSGGGNIASHGQRKVLKDGNKYLQECSEKFCVGIESPQSGNFSHTEDEEAYSSAAYLVVQGESVVTSGDYQRFYEDVQGVRYHHLIDPDTLFPAVHFRSVSIITEDSGLADFLSSAVFLMSYDDGLKLVNSMDGVEAIWLLDDGKIRYSDGLKDGKDFYVIEKERLKDDYGV